MRGDCCCRHNELSVTALGADVGTVTYCRHYLVVFHVPFRMVAGDISSISLQCYCVFSLGRSYVV